MSTAVTMRPTPSMTKAELAQFLQLSKRSIDRMTAAGELPKPRYVGAQRTRPRWDRDEIRQWWSDKA